jgi:PIN domain nuclease of toxin-antitoxin system
VRHTVALSTLPALHRDPIDRLLIAQAQSEQLALVTRDPLLRQYRTKMLRA